MQKVVGYFLAAVFLASGPADELLVRSDWFRVEHPPSERWLKDILDEWDTVTLRLMVRPVCPQLPKCPVCPGGYAWCH
jgi:hypothetical protein